MESHEFPLFHATISIDIVAVMVLFMQPVLEETASPQASWHSGFYFPLPPLWCPPSCDVDVSYGAGLPTICIDLCIVSSCGFLRWSPFAKRGFSLQGVVARLPVDLRKDLECNTKELCWACQVWL